MPFYGKEFSATRLYGPSTGGTELVYSSITPRLKSGWTRYWDEVSKVPYLLNSTNTKFVTYDDSLSLSIKCQYAKQNGLGGVMIWALGQDVINNRQPLLEAISLAMATSTAIAENQSAPIGEFELFNNYPNPFNASTSIAFYLERETTVKLSIYNLLGELAGVLVNAEMAPGRHVMTWDASDKPSGIYFYRLEAGEFKDTRRMVLLR